MKQELYPQPPLAQFCIWDLVQLEVQYLRLLQIVNGIQLHIFVPLAYVSSVLLSCRFVTILYIINLGSALFKSDDLVISFTNYVFTHTYAIRPCDVINVNKEGVISCMHALLRFTSITFFSQCILLLARLWPVLEVHLQKFHFAF